jgi:hypothetical protein
VGWTGQIGYSCGNVEQSQCLLRLLLAAQGILPTANPQQCCCTSAHGFPPWHARLCQEPYSPQLGQYPVMASWLQFLRACSQTVVGTLKKPSLVLLWQSAAAAVTVSLLMKLKHTSQSVLGLMLN